VLAVNTNTSVEYVKSCDGTGPTFTVLYDNQWTLRAVDSARGRFGFIDRDTEHRRSVALLYAGSDTDTWNPVAPG